MTGEQYRLSLRWLLHKDGLWSPYVIWQSKDELHPSVRKGYLQQFIEFWAGKTFNLQLKSTSQSKEIRFQLYTLSPFYFTEIFVWEQSVIYRENDKLGIDIWSDEFFDKYQLNLFIKFSKLDVYLIGNKVSVFSLLSRFLQRMTIGMKSCNSIIISYLISLELTLLQINFFWTT